MADLSITANQVQPGAGAAIKSALAAVAITRGEALYIDGSNGRLYLAQRDSTAHEAKVVGLATVDVGEGQKCEYQSGGVIKIGAGASVVEGTIYFLGATPGTLTPHTDYTVASPLPATSQFTTFIGIGDADDNIKLGIMASGQQKP